MKALSIFCSKKIFIETDKNLYENNNIFLIKNFLFQNNLVGTEVFPCKAYVYTPSKGECRMSAESGMIVGHKKAQTGTLISELSSISAGQYSEKFCLQGKLILI